MRAALVPCVQRSGSTSAVAPDKSTLLAGGGSARWRRKKSCGAGGKGCAVLSEISCGVAFSSGRQVVMDTLAEWLRRRPGKPMGSPRVGVSPAGVACADVERTRSSMRKIAAARE